MGLFSRKPKQRMTRTGGITASAHMIDLRDRNALTQLRRRRSPWQEEAWGYDDAVGEVKYARMYHSNAVSKVRLTPGIDAGPDADPEPDDDPRALDAIARITNPLGGQGEILRKMDASLFIAGETFLVGIAPRGDVTTEIWDARSIDEIKTSGSRIQISGLPGYSDAVTLDPDNDFLLRIWQAHPRYSDQADSGLRGVLNICDDLLLLDRAGRSALKQRIARAGVWYVPTGLSFGAEDPTISEQDGDAPSDPFMDSLADALLTPIQNEGSASALVPIVIRGEKDAIAAARYDAMITPDATLDTRIDRALKRLAQGLNVPVQVVLGMEDVNHWSAWQISEDTFQGHIEPAVLMICNALTAGYYQAALRAMGMSPAEAARRRIWYDASKLVVRPDIGAAATTLYEKDELSGTALRAVLGFTEDDAPTDKELVERLLLKGVRLDPNIQAQMLRDTFYPGIKIPDPASGGYVPPGGLPAAPAAPAAPAPKGAPPMMGPDQAPPSRAASASVDIDAKGIVARAIEAETAKIAAILAAGRRPPIRRTGGRLVAIDGALRARIHVAADAQLKRALEKAGNYVRTRARKDRTLRALSESVDAARVLRVIGPAAVQTLGVNEHDLLANAFAPLRQNFLRWTRKAGSDALNILHAPDAAAFAAGASYEQATEEAWNWFEAALVKAAHDQLYDPAEIVALGEIDASLDVPYSLIRQAVAIAGGTKAVRTDTGGAVITLEGDPVGGIATGPTALDASGDSIDGYEWVYGDYPRTAPFEPHENLDGVQFQNFDDEVLANPESFPEFAFYIPGDHAGCQCDFMPLLASEAQGEEGAA